MSKSPVVLVAPDAGISNGYFNRLAHSMKSSIKQVNSPVELLESSQAQDLLIVAGQSVVSQLSTNDIAKISAQVSVALMICCNSIPNRILLLALP